MWVSWWLSGKESPCQCRRLRFDPWLGRSPGEGNGNPSNILDWEIPWTEEPGRLQSMLLQRVGRDWAHMHGYTGRELVKEKNIFFFKKTRIWQLSLSNTKDVSVEKICEQRFAGTCNPILPPWSKSSVFRVSVHGLYSVVFKPLQYFMIKWPLSFN